MPHTVCAWRSPSTTDCVGGPPPRAGEDIAGAAARLAGLAGALLGWTAEQFWRATPAELAGVVKALMGDAREAAPPDAVTIARLQEAFPDG